MSSEIEASVGITKNIGNYESLKLEARKRVDVDPSKDETEQWTDLWKEVQDQLEAQLAEAGLAIG